MFRLLTRFFDDIHRISETLQNFDMHGVSTHSPMQDVLVTLCQADRDLLANFRRRKPKAKELAS